MRRPARWALSISACALFAIAGCYEETYLPPSGPGPWVLVDLYHTRIQNPQDYRLERDTYAYQGSFGYARAFDHLRENGFSWRAIRENRLSEQRLEGFDVLFINLVHEERPDFDDEEVADIVEFVREGGGLFVIADHTNVYYHAERINRFLAPMGIEVTYHSALEPGDRSLSGLGWLEVTDFADHPVNEGVELMGFQTGGSMVTSGDRATLTALTSPESFGDLWDESSGRGFYGNWRHDGDEEVEPRGPLGIMAAAEFGQGRVVVVGDQNLYGDAMLHFADNFRHMMNAFDWLAGEAASERPPLARQRPAGVNIGVDLRLSDLAPGRAVPNAYYNFFVNVNRDPSVTGRAIWRLDGDDDALILPTPAVAPSDDDLAAIRDYLDAGKRVALLLNVEDAMKGSEPVRALLAGLAPELTFRVGLGEEESVEVRLMDQDWPRGQARRLDGTRTLAPGALLENALEDFAAWQGSGHEDEDPNERDPYLVEVRSEWGEALIETTDGIAIARRKRVGPGELIVFFQDGFWRNHTLGLSESQSPPRGARPAIELQYQFIDYLKEPIGAQR